MKNQAVDTQLSAGQPAAHEIYSANKISPTASTGSSKAAQSLLCRAQVKSPQAPSDSLGDALLPQASVQAAGSTRSTKLQRHRRTPHGEAIREAREQRSWKNPNWIYSGIQKRLAWRWITFYRQSPLIFCTDIPSIECLNKTTVRPVK